MKGQLKIEPNSAVQIKKEILSGAGREFPVGTIHSAKDFPDLERHIRLGNVDVLNGVLIDPSKSTEEQLEATLADLHAAQERCEHIEDLNSRLTQKIKAQDEIERDNAAKTQEIDHLKKLVAQLTEENRSVKTQLIAVTKGKNGDGKDK